MLLEERITLLAKLGAYFLNNNVEWQETVEQAHRRNTWFTPEFIQLSAKNIALHFLQKEQLEQWIKPYPSFRENMPQPEVGLVMAGNIPLVGFHDFLCVFISGCRLRMKLSSKDTVLWEHIFALLSKWNPDFTNFVSIAERLKSCDAYIATGNNNSARYFEYYFQRYPRIIRANRTSVAVLSGKESLEELGALSDDICTYFGLGCRNVTQIFVPKDYDFKPLLSALDKYAGHFDHNKYKHNYDFQLALYLLNNIPYMSSKAVLLVPSESAFAPISVLHYRYYEDAETLLKTLNDQKDLQCIAGNGKYFEKQFQMLNFGKSQQPGLADYADGVNTLDFLAALKKM